MSFAAQLRTEEGWIMQKRSKRWSWLIVGLCALPAVAVLPGCGGGSGGPNLVGPGQLFAGTYNGTFTGRATGTLAFTVSNTGAITATVNSDNLRSIGTAKASAGGTIGTRALYTGSGTVGQGGAFSFTVTNGGVTITFYGLLSSNNSVVTISNGQWSSTSGLTGTFTASPTGATPTPSASPSPTPTSTTPGGSAGCGTGSGSATFSNITAGSADTSNLTGTNFQGQLNTNNGNVTAAVLTFSNGCQSVPLVRAFSVSLNSVSANIVAGRTYSLTPSGGLPSVVASVIYTETVPSTQATEFWLATGGSVRIDSISGNVVKFSLLNARFTPPTTPGGGTPGTGSFTVTGSATVTVTRSGT